jgi:hypothetical protein
MKGSKKQNKEKGSREKKTIEGQKTNCTTFKESDGTA